MVVVVAGLSMLVVLLPGGGRPRPAAWKGSVLVPVYVPVWHLRAAAPAQLLSPFTGEPVRALGRVVVVKIDNIVQARPPTGLTSADIVYLLPVEGGLSRIFAVFSSRFPRIIGPVRSAREDDLELLRQFGRPGFAYSGATPHLLPFTTRARVVNLYDTPAYFRDGNRVAPHNLYAYARMLRAEAAGASTAHDIGFRFGPPPPGGRARDIVQRFLPGGVVHLPLVAADAPLAGLDGRHAGDRRRRRGPRGGHHGDPVHGRADVPVPGIRRPSPVCPVRRFRHRGGAARRALLARALVPARPGQRHDLHPALGRPDDIRARSGVGRPHHHELGESPAVTFSDVHRPSLTLRNRRYARQLLHDRSASSPRRAGRSGRVRGRL